jgi:hypothetical protein
MSRIFCHQFMWSVCGANNVQHDIPLQRAGLSPSGQGRLIGWGRGALAPDPQQLRS